MKKSPNRNNSEALRCPAIAGKVRVEPASGQIPSLQMEIEGVHPLPHKLGHNEVT